MAETLKEDLDKALMKAKMGATLVIVLGLLSVGVVGYWLNYAHNEFVAFTPERAAASGAYYVNQSIPDIEPQIKDQIIKAAPDLMKAAEEQLNNMPDKFADMMMSSTEAELNKLVPQLQTELVESMKAAIEKAKAQRAPGVSDADYIKALMNTLADAYAQESTSLVDELKTKYASQGADVLAHLEHLADNKKLTKRESLERQALVTFLTIASRAKSASATGGM